MLVIGLAPTHAADWSPHIAKDGQTKPYEAEEAARIQPVPTGYKDLQGRVVTESRFCALAFNKRVLLRELRP